MLSLKLSRLLVIASIFLLHAMMISLACGPSETPPDFCPNLAIYCPVTDFTIQVCSYCTLQSETEEGDLVYIKFKLCDTGEVLQTSFHSSCELVK